MGIHYKITAVVTTPYLVKTTDQKINVNVAGLASIILPAHDTSSREPDDEILVTGCTFIIKDASGNSLVNPITILTTGGLLIDAATFAIINADYAYVTVIFNGAKWEVIE